MDATAGMTSKERWLAALSLEPVDRLPFWPKLDASYPMHRNPPFRDMPVPEIHDWIGSDRHDGVAPAIREVRPHTAFETIRDNGESRDVFRTPHGELTRVNRFDPVSQSRHPMSFPVKTVDDVKIMTEWYADCRPELDQEGLAEVRDRCRSHGGGSLTVSHVGQSALMHWVEWLAGVQNAHYLLVDHTDDVLALFEQMHRVLLRRAEILADRHPADAFYMVENTSTTLISVAQYRTYNAQHITQYAEIMQGADRHLLLHMCGHLKGLLGDLARIPCSGFEAFTAPTLGNTTLLDGRTACPDKCLIGGTQATDWLEPPDEIIARIGRSLHELPHHRGIVVTSAGVMPPVCPPETIKTVCEWVKGYAARA